MEIITQLGALSYLGVFGVSLIASIFLPFPEEVTLIALGYLSGNHIFHWFFIIPISMVGLFISDWVIYVLSYKGSRITRFIYTKFFSNFNFLENPSKERVEKMIVITRFLPHFRFLAPFLAGYYKFSFKDFSRHEIISLSVYIPFFVFLGYFLGNHVQKILNGVHIFKNIIIGIIIIGIFWFIIISLKKYFIRSLESFKKNKFIKF